MHLKLRMRRYTTAKQPVLAFALPFEGHLDTQNKWVILANALPWDDLVKPYLKTLCQNNGRPSVDARQVVAAFIIKHLKNLSDEQTIDEIKENPYLQYFAGLHAFQQEKLFEPSLFVALRKRMGDATFDEMNDVILKCFATQTPPKGKDTETIEETKDEKTEDKTEDNDDKTEDKNEDKTEDKAENKSNKSDDSKADKSDKSDLPAPHGHLKIDTTVAPQNITFPTDLKLLNKCRVHTEHLIDGLYHELNLDTKPRTYRKDARQAYLKIARIKRKTKKKIRQGIKEQLNYIRRNVHTINTLWDKLDELKADKDQSVRPENWTATDFRNWLIIQEVYRQQREMYDTHTNRTDHRIVSISQPHVRPIVRGKEHKNTEFGAKIGLSTCNGYTRLDHFSWEAYHDAADLKLQVERYKTLHGYYPETVNADKIYHTSENHRFLKSKGIRFIGKPLGRPTKESLTPTAQRVQRAEKAQRNHIEGKIGQMKTAYGMENILAKTDTTARAWIAAIVLVTNLVRVLKDLCLMPKSKLTNILYHISFFIKCAFSTKRSPAF